MEPNKEAVLQTSIEASTACELWLDCLALIYHTYYCAHSGHWNIKGESFSSWHKFLNDAYDFWHDLADTVAEHIRATFKDTDIPNNFQALLSRVQGDPTEGIEHDGIGYFQALLVYQEAAATVFNTLAKTADAEGDQASLDLAATTLREVKKYIWQTRSHLE